MKRKKEKLPNYINYAVNQFMDCLTEYSDRTKRNYKIGLVRYLKWYGKRPKKNEPMLQNMKKYRGFLLNKKYSPTAINTYLFAAKKFYNLIIGKYDEIEPVTVSRKRKKLETYSPEEINKLIQATHNLKHKIFFRLAYCNGCTIRELLSITMVELMKAPYKEIQLKKRKIKIDDETFKMIAELIRGKSIDEMLFTNSNGVPITERAIQHAFSKTVEKAGLPKKGGLQSLRHSYAEQLLRSGVDMRELSLNLGHSTYKTTQVMYRKNIPKKKNYIKPVDLLEPLKVQLIAEYKIKVYSDGKTTIEKI